MRRPDRSIRRLTALALLWAAAAQGHAATCVGSSGFDCTLSFADSGTVRITFLNSDAGFDHRFSLYSPGPATELFYATSGDPATWTTPTPTSPGSFVDVAGYTGGSELVFRLDGLITLRIGNTDPSEVGTLATQVFTGSLTGSSTGVSTGSGPHFSFVEGVGTNTLNVRMADLFGQSDASRITQFEFQVALVPEPHEWAMMLSGLGLVGWMARRRRTDAAPGPAALPA